MGLDNQLFPHPAGLHSRILRGFPYNRHLSSGSLPFGYLRSGSFPFRHLRNGSFPFRHLCCGSFFRFRLQPAKQYQIPEALHCQYCHTDQIARKMRTGSQAVTEALPDNPHHRPPCIIGLPQRKPDAPKQPFFKKGGNPVRVKQRRKIRRPQEMVNVHIDSQHRSQHRRSGSPIAPFCRPAFSPADPQKNGKQHEKYQIRPHQRHQARNQK